MDTRDLLLHPVRLRIVHAMSGARARTTSELCARLPDIPKTTVYRHVALLVEGAVLEVAEEQRVRGAVERHYRLRRDRAAIDADAATSMSLDDHRRGFAAAMAALLTEFNAYLERDGADPGADSVGYRQGTLWLNPDELAEMVGALREVFTSRAANKPSPGRSPHLVSAIFFPGEESPQHRTDQQADQRS
ncbi:helix-turn-helix domain-containing protein [Kitasatospora sp. MAP5-34]|uniref:helix-turn-helix domain-containing protein n=1 Tax=Kitasatospora sp. MAP5-34 TaxID=3035102 RepID=UPI0024744168|nr:helix-turn-helix domain-containing protein [Kitasatospora sp. MAP5-34]MDH6577370.1 DNA-binding transcriptional ArsR family regulator [Kitasatospora sp. MAP5-34]